MILASFAKGLVHDGYKIYQYRLTGLRGEVREAFDPCLKDGTVLDFKLVHPSGLSWDWQTEIRMPGRRNMLEFLEIVPRELLKSMPVEINSAIIANICDMDTCDADQESASRDLRCKNGMETRSTVLNAVRDYFTRAPGRARPADTVFYINEQWCAVAMPAFFKQLLPLPGFRDVSSVCQYLGYENTLAEQSAEIFLASVAFQCAKDGKTFRHEKMSLAFLRTDYLRKAVANEVDGLAVATFCLEDAAALSAIGIPDSFFSKWPDPPKKENNSAGAQGTESGQQSDPARTSLPGLRATRIRGTGKKGRANRSISRAFCGFLSGCPAACDPGTGTTGHRDESTRRESTGADRHDMRRAFPSHGWPILGKRFTCGRRVARLPG